MKRINDAGLYPVIGKAIEAEANAGFRIASDMLNDNDSVFFAEFASMTLYSMHPRVIQELVYSNLVLTTQSDTDLQEYLNHYYKFARKHPSNYIQLLVNTEGNSITS